MGILIEGKDWQTIDIKNGLRIQQPDLVLDAENGNASERGEYSSEYFYRYHSLFGHEPSPFNLGIYQTPVREVRNEPGRDRDIDVIKATKYVGIVPLLKLNDDTVTGDEKPVAKISSRFGISPTEMISEVLSGDDYYNNPDMLSMHSYSISEWMELKGKTKEDDNKEIFGLINGLGEIDLFQNHEGDGKADAADLGIIDEYGVFEIIDFVNKAKILCKKNLKKQSQRVEENLNCKVKGRILIQKQIKYNVSKGQNQKTYCAYNKMSEDIRENQILKYALHLCRTKHGIGDSLSEDIQICMNALSGVPLKKCSMSDFIGLKNNGAYKQYKDALNAAKKVIGRYSIDYSPGNSEGTKEPGIRLTSGRVLPYFIDMNLLFEYYCRAIFSKAIKSINSETDNNSNINIFFELESTKKAKRILFHVSDDYWNKYVIRDDEEEESNKEAGTEKNMQRFFMPVYIPDIVVNYKVKNDNGEVEAKGVAAVFDAKYSDVERQEKRSRTHQVMFYMNALGCDFGGLISPYVSKQPSESGDRPEYYTGLSTNHCVDGGNPAEIDRDDTQDGSSMLFYIPLDYSKNRNSGKNDTERYVDITKSYLSIIRDEVAEKEKQRRQRKSEKKQLSEIRSILENKKVNQKTVSIQKSDMEKIESFINRII